MKLTKGNLVMYNGRQATVIKYYIENNIEYVDLRRGYKEKFFKIPAEDVYFIAEKRAKNLN